MSVKIVVIGAGGFLGRELTKRLVRSKDFHVDPEKTLSLSELVLFDLDLSYFKDNLPFSEDNRVRLLEENFCDVAALRKAVSYSPDFERIVVYQLTTVPSGMSEKDFDLCRKVNLEAPMTLLEVMRETGQRMGRPLTLVYASSDYVACYNDANKENAFSEEGFRLSPTSYGICKACMELLVCDYTRRGFVDGRVARISSVIGRPEPFNSMTSEFSMIFTQTLRGRDHEISQPLESKIPCSSVDNDAICLILLGGKVRGDLMGHNRVVQLPATSYSLQQIWTCAQSIAKLYNLKMGSLIHREPCEANSTFREINLVPNVDCRKARELGLPDGYNLEAIMYNFLLSEGLLEARLEQKVSAFNFQAATDCKNEVCVVGARR